MKKKMTDKQLLAKIEELDKLAMKRYLMGIANKQVVTKVKNNYKNK